MDTHLSIHTFKSLQSMRSQEGIDWGHSHVSWN